MKTNLVAKLQTQPAGSHCQLILGDFIFREQEVRGRMKPGADRSQVGGGNLA